MWAQPTDWVFPGSVCVYLCALSICTHVSVYLFISKFSDISTCVCADVSMLCVYYLYMHVFIFACVYMFVFIFP